MEGWGIEGSRLAPRMDLTPTHRSTNKDLRTVPRRSLADLVGEALEETRRLEEELAFLEENLPPLQAKLDGAVRPLLEAIVLARKDLARLVERQLLAHARDRRFQREATELLLHIVSDLQERFGVDLSTTANPADPDSDDDLDERDDASWARPEMHEPRRPPERRNPRRAPVDPEAAAKGIYRSLARELHPDKTRDETERDRRTELMRKLTAAWQERDLPALLRLLHAHGSDEAKEGSLDEASLKACLQGVEDNRDRLRLRLRNLRHQGLPGGVVDWMTLVRDPKLFEKVLRREKRPAREELEQVLRLKGWFSTREGLDRFLREIPWEDWPAVV